VQSFAYLQVPQLAHYGQLNSTVSFCSYFAFNSLETIFSETAHAECIPVDTCVNAMIAIAWKEAKDDRKYHNYLPVSQQSQLPIYNLTCSEDSRITAKKSGGVMNKMLCLYPFENIYWRPKLTITESSTINKVKQFLF